MIVGWLMVPGFTRSTLWRGRRMTGSAFKAMDVVVGCLSYEMGGGLEEGGLNIGPDPEAGGFSLTRA